MGFTWKCSKEWYKYVFHVTRQWAIQGKKNLTYIKIDINKHAHIHSSCNDELWSPLKFLNLPIWFQLELNFGDRTALLKTIRVPMTLNMTGTSSLGKPQVSIYPSFNLWKQKNLMSNKQITRPELRIDTLRQLCTVEASTNEIVWLKRQFWHT